MSTATHPAVTIVPYARERDRGDLLYQAWRLVEESGEVAKLFWDTPVPQAYRGDLQFFVRHVTDPSRQLFVLFTPESWIGLAWAEGIHVGQHCYLSLFLCPDKRGPVGHAATRLLLDTLETVYDVQHLFYTTPWPAAKMLGLMMGFRPVGTLPHHAEHDGKLLDVTIMQRERRR
jgi:hypothetical protein